MTKPTSAKTLHSAATASVANQRYVPALTEQRPAITGEVLHSLVPTDAQTIYVDNAMPSRDGAHERTSAMDRSKAFLLRMSWMAAVWLVLAIGVSWAASMGGWWTLIMFTGLTSATYAYLDRQEREYSTNGVERYRISTAADLRLAEMEHQQELRRMAMRAHLKMLGVNDDLT